MLIKQNIISYLTQLNKAQKKLADASLFCW